MTTSERDELFGLFLAALHVVVPEVTNDQLALVRGVLDGMLRERDASPEPWF